MEELIKLLDENLEYVDYSILNDTIYINVRSVREYAICSYCNTTKVHSYYKRSFQDLTIQDKKTVIILSNRKMFCVNNDYKHTTFAETFDFIKFKSKKTSSLQNEIINISQNVSSMSAAKMINTRIANIGKSTIFNLLKNNDKC
ncbi:transposase family protein [Tissierella praeacuta]|uniref:transposase family protein n=1 Tax=Tissierella praeacuta TaxID=43131 RepID=UPI00289E6D86|nr:transposase family protein [Tissierella praeacuta]